VTEIDVVVARPGEATSDVTAVAVAEPAAELPRAAASLDERADARLAQLVADREISGRRDTATVVHVSADGAPRIAVAGLGERDEVDADAFRTAAAAVARAVKSFASTLSWIVDDSLPLPPEEQARAVVEGVVLGAYDALRWKTNRPERSTLERLVIVADGDGIEPAVSRAAIVARWTNRARDLSNAPANELTPERLAATAEEIAADQPTLSVDAIGLERARELGMGAFGAVAQGSRNEGRMIVIRYEPEAPASETVLGLVGKAITFDTGGISIKPSEGMQEMKHDMSGGAAVVGAMGAIAELGLAVRTIAVVAAAENMPDGAAYRPGDILTASNGKTIEVISTDAEGRLVLADALVYARNEGATHVVDLATLTGAMVVALGDLYAGVFANDDGWREQIVEAGAASGDLVWPMPLDRRYRRMIDSDYADMRNTGRWRMAGAQAGAELLQEFAGEGPWAHVDIAGPAALSYGRGDYLSQKGGTGYGVRLLAALATRLA
jgi:leucyl aminopeptidase